MAGEKEFMYFLVAGLVIIALLMLVFGLNFTGGPTRSSLLGLGSPIFVGAADFESVETLHASFAANNFREVNTYSLGSRQVTNGLLFGSNSISLNVGMADFVDVSFDIVRTNGYGTLMIKADGQMVQEARLEIGHYEFSFGPASEVEIASGSSEWRIWAPSLYGLENLKITATGYPRDISTFTFEVDEPEKVGSVRVDFSLEDNAGVLLLKLNGDVVYDGALNTRQSIFLDSSKLDELNIITFDARPDSRFSGLATVAFTKVTQQEKELQAVINLTQSEYNEFRKGAILFDVVDVFKPGGYSIKIMNNNTVMFNEFVKLEKGYYEFAIEKNNLRPGLNMIIIRSLDGSAFHVQGLTARL